MSISINNVSKFYGEQTALQSVSLNIKKGEVVGFLGPNGAGKSTLMKIITCYLSANEGEVKVCGVDVKEDSLSVRSKVGYLPEHNPMYLEMYIKEYLEFVAGVYKSPKERISEMINITGITAEQHKKLVNCRKDTDKGLD